MAIRLSEIGKPSLRNIQSWYKDQKLAEQGTEPGAEVKCCSAPPPPIASWSLEFSATRAIPCKMRDTLPSLLLASPRASPA